MSSKLTISGCPFGPETTAKNMGVQDRYVSSSLALTSTTSSRICSACALSSKAYAWRTKPYAQITCIQERPAFGWPSLPISSKSFALDFCRAALKACRSDKFYWASLRVLMRSFFGWGWDELAGSGFY